MIIVPTEKSLDWRYAPVVLFAIVTLNVLVFFLYQSGDDDKWQVAVSSYWETGLAELELPLYERYLKEQGREEELQAAQTLVAAEAFLPLGITILEDPAFFLYARQTQLRELTAEDYETWLAVRTTINAIHRSISFISLGLRPSELSPLTLLSHQFLHGDIMHLLGNMFFLIVCGFAVEAAIGHKKFLLFYLLSGIAGGLAHALIDLDSEVPLVGASGAISGVMAMYLALFRMKKIEFFYWFFVFVGYIRAPALLILPFYIGNELYSFYSDPDGEIAFMAHVGGFVAGASVIFYTLYRTPQQVNESYIEEDQSRDPQHEKRAKIYQLIENYRFDLALKHCNDYIDNFGADFEAALLRFNLSRLTNTPNHSHYAKALFAIKRLAPIEIEKLEQAWQASEAIHGQLPPQILHKLGVNFCSINRTDSAEKIFAQLEQLPEGDLDLGVLARRLALNFEQQNNKKKQHHYQQIADHSIAKC